MFLMTDARSFIDLNYKKPYEDCIILVWFFIDKILTNIRLVCYPTHIDRGAFDK